MNTLTDILQRESARLHQAADKHAELMRIGKGAADALRSMVAALNCDYDRLQSIREDIANGTQCRADADLLPTLESTAADCESRDEAEQRIHEDALSVEVRDGWYPAGDHASSSEEFRILLSTGGPATRIIGELQNGDPMSARLEVQDWGTSWTEYREKGLENVLLDYARCFYFGEG